MDGDMGKVNPTRALISATALIWLNACADTGDSLSSGRAVETCAQAQRDLMARQDAIQAKLDANFIDDPLRWIADQAAVPFDVDAYDFKRASVSRRCP